MSGYAIEVEGLRKSYGKIVAVDDISFSVEKGRLFAFLGPNGAGKSTTIDIICTFLRPDSGDVAVDGKLLGRDNEEIRRSIGAVFQDGLLDRLLTVGENLRIRGGFYGLRGRELDNAVKNAAAQAGVTELLRRSYGKLSGGQRRRCDIARALINAPKILFLDEPTTGLDPQTRRSVRQTVADLQDKTGMTVFLTTHYMEEAEEADRVVVIDGGRIAACGTPFELRRRYACDRLTLAAGDEDSRIRLELFLKDSRIPFTHAADKFVLRIGSTLESLPIIEKVKPYISGFEVTEGTMDDAFIGITGKEIRE